MSHDETDPAPTPPTDPAPTPPSTPPETPPAPAAPNPPAPTPPVPGSGDGSSESRMTALETMVGNIVDSVTHLTEAIANGGSKEVQPQKMPWTHWGSKKKEG